MSNQVQNSYRTPSLPARQPQPAVRPTFRWSWRETSICAFLVLFIVTGYFTVYRFEFVYFDDPGYVSENLDVLRGLPLFRNFEDFKKSVYWAFTAFEQSNWHPLSWLSHMLDVEIYQHWAGGHHITNIILHALNTLLLFALFWRMTGKSWRCAAVAAMFAVHPMHVESVAWVAERKDVLSTCLGLLTLHAYVTYSRSARLNGAFFLFSATSAAIIGMLAWLWYSLCFWYKHQVVWFQQTRIVPAKDVFERFQQQVEFLRHSGFSVPIDSSDWYSQQADFLRLRHWDAVLPIAYDGYHLTCERLVYFGAALILALIAVGVFAMRSNRTRLLKNCTSLLSFALVGAVMLAGIWFARGANEFAGPPEHRWINWFGGAVVLLAFAGGAVAAAMQRRAATVQCAIFGCSVAGLMIVLHWIAQLPPPAPPPIPDWYTSPLQTVVERIWCSEFAVALFIVFGGVAVDAVLGHRRNVLLYSVVIALYTVGLLAKPMLVTLPFVMLLLDFWPLVRMDVGTVRQKERPVQPSAEAMRALRRRTRQKRTLPAAAIEQPSAAAVWPRIIATLVRLMMLVLEKAPLLALAAASSMVTPLAQKWGGSMASENDLPVWFRIQNAIKSLDVYIGKMFWPGKMMSLHLLAQDEKGQPYVEQSLFWLAVVVVVVLSAVAVAAFFLGRRYVTFGWLWYVGLLVPVIGFVQVGEQRWADRYTYMPYVGLFIAVVWGIGDLLDSFPRWRRLLLFASAIGTACVFISWIPWTNYQAQTWHDRERHLRHALEVEPDNWNMLNNLGVHLWKSAMVQDGLAAEAEADGKTAEAAVYREKSKELKDSAIDSWLHGIRARPTATDIHSNLGYMYSERNQLDKAEYHLTKAVELKDISPRPHNNLGRVLLRRSQESEVRANAAARLPEAEARLRDAEAKGATSKTEAAKIPQLRAEVEQLRADAPNSAKFKAEAKEKLDQAIFQFERSVQLDPSLLEARLNLGEVYTQMGKYDDATKNYLKILDLDNPSVVEPDAIRNFSQAYFGLARIAFAKGNADEGFAKLKVSIAKNPENTQALERFAKELFVRDKYHDGEQVLWLWFSRMPSAARPVLAQRLGAQLAGEGKQAEALRALGTAAWIFATSPEPKLRNPVEAGRIAEQLVRLSKQQDPLALDTFAAAAAANGRFDYAVRAARDAMNLATAQGNKALADLISARLTSYQNRRPYVSDPNGSDRP